MPTLRRLEELYISPTPLVLRLTEGNSVRLLREVQRVRLNFHCHVAANASKTIATTVSNSVD